AKSESRGSIAERLERAGLVRSSTAFQILVVKEGLGRKIQAGDFRLSPAMTSLEIAQQLTHGTLDRWVTLVEGWRREETGQYLASNFQFPNSNFQYEEFLDLTGDLEGKLFPDTYLLPKDVDAKRLVAILTLNFEKKTANLKPEKKDLILASIVEREAKFEADRPIVAGILLNRLEHGWPLQADATVQYVVGSKKCEVGKVKCEWWPKNLTRDDLEIKSPYNTYLYTGLPAGPICSPGLAAIKAAMSPAETDYLYYLSDSEGKMHYARTLEEHNENIAKYLY
ncbi:MAG: endolytic transglycosylase MltG, partial [Methanomicrobiales archaeon]|nr:endolytic transglycosylase MltG [Methanomicrobiales archaeon]